MFGGLTKTSSRIAIAAALGLTLGGFAFKATPAKAADLGGDCCADLEERVAELEATTVRKGNKKVSVTLSGWVIKSMNWWDDGDDRQLRRRRQGLRPWLPLRHHRQRDDLAWLVGWFQHDRHYAGARPSASAAIRFDEFDGGQRRFHGSTFGDINTLYSYIYIKSDTWGTLNWGHLSPASDNPAVLADISGTVIESNFGVLRGRRLLHCGRRAAIQRYRGLTPSCAGTTSCSASSGGRRLAADCFGAAQPAVRYDSPTWGGFRFETSYGTATWCRRFSTRRRDYRLVFDHPSTDDSDFWDIAAVLHGRLEQHQDLGWPAPIPGLEANPLNGWRGRLSVRLAAASCISRRSRHLCHAADWEESATATTIAVGLVGIYGLYAALTQAGSCGFRQCPDDRILRSTVLRGHRHCGVSSPSGGRPGSPIGATVLFGEYAQYNDYVRAGGTSAAGFGLGPMSATSAISAWTRALAKACSSRLRSGALGPWRGAGDRLGRHACLARWQHQELDVDLLRPRYSAMQSSQSFDDWDLFQVGGIIFF